MASGAAVVLGIGIGATLLAIGSVGGCFACLISGAIF